MNKSFYHRPEWETLRRIVLDENHNDCERCRLAGRYAPADTVHHRLYRRARPDLALTRANLEALCSECHYKEHHTIEYKPKLNIEKW